jgi:hypothetical protein
LQTELFDVSQALRRTLVGVQHEFVQFSTSANYLIIKSYPTKQTFQIRCSPCVLRYNIFWIKAINKKLKKKNFAMSSFASENAGVARGSILFPVLYNIFVSDPVLNVTIENSVDNL